MRKRVGERDLLVREVAGGVRRPDVAADRFGPHPEVSRTDVQPAAFRTATGDVLPRILKCLERPGSFVLLMWKGGPDMKLDFPGETAEYRAARNELLGQEIALRRQMEAVAARLTRVVQEHRA